MTSPRVQIYETRMFDDYPLVLENYFLTNDFVCVLKDQKRVELVCMLSKPLVLGFFVNESFSMMLAMRATMIVLYHVVCERDRLPKKMKNKIVYLVELEL